MRRMYIERQMERFLKFEDPAYAASAQMVMAMNYDRPDEAISFYNDWLTVSQALRDSGTQVFVFDPDAQEEIMRTEGALSAKDVYRAFPYDAAYVSISHPMLDGFAVMKMHEESEVGFMFMFREDYISEHASDSRGLEASVPYSELDLDAVCNLTSYISAKNADMNLVYKPSEKVRASGGGRKRKSCATVTEVGFRIGSALREYRMSQRASAHGDGTVRPHVRRAHWHRYWVGPMSGERRLELRWLEPIFVNPGGGDMVPTAHEVGL